MMRTAALSTTLLLLLGACDPGSRVLSIEATGLVGGLVYLDRNGDGAPDANDGPVKGAVVEARLHGNDRVVARDSTDARGFYLLRDVPVGSYRLTIGNEILADSLSALPTPEPHYTVGAGDTVRVMLGVTHPAVSVQEARELPAGRTVYVEGTALTGTGVFGDGTLHLQGRGGAIAATRMVAVPVNPGDSVRILGTLRTLNGQPTLDEARPVVVRTALLPFPKGLPDPEMVTSAVAATADGGRLDAGQVRLAGAVVTDTATVVEGFRLTVDDGSGPVPVLLDWEANFQRDALFEPSRLVPGAEVDVAGVLVATASGGWQLKPRGKRDVARLVFRTVTVAEARQLPAGQRIQVEGLALTAMVNGIATFGDATAHLLGTGASIRAARVASASFQPGDSMRFVATTGTLAGQPVLLDVQTTLLRTAVLPFPDGLPDPETVSTGVAAIADGGRLDAAQMRLESATIADTATVDGDYHLTVNDGSGNVVVVLDQHADFRKTASFDPAQLIPGKSIEARGVLVPSRSGSWTLKPRDSREVILR